MEAFSAGTLAGAGSFRCDSCGFGIALQERDQVPSCPECGGESFRRSSLFGETVGGSLLSPCVLRLVLRHAAPDDLGRLGPGSLRQFLGERDEARQDRRHLDAREVHAPGARVAPAS